MIRKLMQIVAALLFLGAVGGVKAAELSDDQMSSIVGSGWCSTCGGTGQCPGPQTPGCTPRMISVTLECMGHMAEWCDAVGNYDVCEIGLGSCSNTVNKCGRRRQQTCPKAADGVSCEDPVVTDIGPCAQGC